MILKQRFADGRTNFKDIGNDFMIVTRASQEDFNHYAKKHCPPGHAEDEKLISFVLFGKEVEPIYDDFPQWIYSNDGQLFLTLNTPPPNTLGGKEISKPKLEELQSILQKMDYYKKDDGYMAVSGGQYTYFEEKPNEIDSQPITRAWVLKMIEEA